MCSTGKARSSRTSAARSRIPASPTSSGARSRRQLPDASLRRGRRRCTCLRGAGRGLRAPAHVAELPPGPGDVPDLPHDAGHVRLTGGAADQGVHREENRRVLDGEADRVGPGGQLRAGDPRSSLSQGLRPARVVAADRRRARRSARARVRRLALGRTKGPRGPRRAGRVRARRGDRASPRRSAGTLRLMGGRLGISFAAGFVSVVLPCVLPLIPGYLAALSSVEAGRLGERGTARRVVVSSLPFILGFTVVFVVLGAGAAAIGTVLSATARTQVAGFILVVLGLAFVGLLPVPERVLAPGLLTGARRRGSGALLGGAFAVCAAPCIGSVLGAVLVLASTSGTVLKGTVLLAAYALGLGAAFLVAGLAFARAMGAFRWLRDRYNLIQVASGIVLIALGLLLFFHREWWLQVAVNRALIDLGLSKP